MGNLGECMHDGCYRRAVRVVSYEKPNHKQFKGQSHNCCSVHSKGSARVPEELTEENSIKCSEKDCDRRVKNHAWAKIKAEDWFFMKDGSAYCPDHHPDWVADWRSRQKEKERG